MSAQIVGDEEILAHFVLENSKFKGDGVNHRLFIPSPKTGNKSVFRVSGMTDLEIATHGTEFVAGPQQRTVLGWAELGAGAVRTHGLSVTADEPPPKHALIANWPEAPEAIRSLAMALAEKAVVKRPPIAQ